MTLARTYRYVTTDPADRKDQHSVARSYLKAWCDPATPNGAYLWVSPKDRSSEPKWVSPRKAFTVPDINTLVKGDERNLSLEALYGEIETAFGRVKNKIVSGVQPDTNDIEAVVAFVAAQMVRTSKFRDGWDMSVPNNASIDAIRDSPLRMAIETTMATLTTNGPQLLSFFALPEAIKRLAAMRATFLKTDDGVGFVTSDSPCCVVLYKNQSGNAFRYLEASTTNVLMPLGPSVAVILDHSPEPHEMRAVTSDHPKIHEINALLWSGAIERIVLPHKAVRPEWFSDGVTARLSRYRVV